MRRMTVKWLQEGVRDNGPKGLLEMTSLCISWMTFPELWQKHMHPWMQMIGRRLFKVKWIPFSLTEHGKYVHDRWVVNLLDANGYSKRSYDQMAPLKSIKLGSWPRVLPKRKERISLIPTHLLLG